MKIILSPQLRGNTLTLVKAGDVLTINGESFDFSLMGAGDTLPHASITSLLAFWFMGDVDRTLEGELVLNLLLPLPENYSPEQAFPVPLLDVPDGPVALPQPLSMEEFMVRDGEFTV